MNGDERGCGRWEVWISDLLKYLIAPGHKSSVIDMARSSPSGKISRLISMSSSSSSSSWSSSAFEAASGDDLAAFLFSLFSRSIFVASLLSSSLTFRPMKPNQAKKLRPPIPVFSILRLRIFCSGVKPPFFAFPFDFELVSRLFCSTSQALHTSPNSPPVKSLPSFHLISTGSLTNPHHPSLALLYQNFFSSFSSWK